MSKDTQKKLRESFRPVNAVKSIAQLKNENPNLTYKHVRYDEHLDPNGDRIDRYIDKGWSIVSTKESIVDDRNATKSEKEESLRLKPMTWNGKGTSGAKFVTMSIPKEDFLVNHKAKAKADADKLARRQYVKRKGNELHITGSEINEGNVNNNSEE